MRLDLAIGLVKVLTDAESPQGGNAFEALVKDTRENLSLTYIINSLIQWLLFNYMGIKGRNAPSASRIFTLSTEIESLVNKISVSDEALSHHYINITPQYPRKLPLVAMHL